MDTAVLDYGLETEESLNQSAFDLSVPESSPNLKCFFLPVRGELARWLPALVLTYSVFTGGITDFESLPRQLQQDQLCSATEATEINQSQPDRQISLREARQMALQVLAETEKNLREERMAEARFIAGLWDNGSQDV